MKKVSLVIAVIGSMFLAIGTVIVFANHLQTHGSYRTIQCYGYVKYLDEESEPTESKSETGVDTRGYIPIVAGLGLLSIAFLDGIVKKKHK